MALAVSALLLAGVPCSPAGSRDTSQAAGASQAAGKQAVLSAGETEHAIGKRMNAATVSIVTGTPGGTYFRVGADLAFVLDDERLRVLPILGKGAGQNAYDLRFLKGVDLAFLRTDTQEQLREDKRLASIGSHIRYIAKLFDDELHIIGPNSVTEARQLAGKRVTFDVKGSGTDYSGRAMFRNLGVTVQAINVDQPTAFEMLRKGEVDAVVSVAAKPVAVVAGFAPGDRFHLIPTKYGPSISDAYLPASLTRQDYPNLVRDEDEIETLAVGTVLGVYNHPKGSERYARLARFVDAFFGKFDEFLAPQRHSKWRDVNLAAGVGGWMRFEPAQEWLDAHHEPLPGAEFMAFLNERRPSASADKEGLYQAFLHWRRDRGSADKEGLYQVFLRWRQYRGHSLASSPEHNSSLVKVQLR
ncbi:TAXI family TRAP transporter solute-binding subunit [Methylobacterium sp. WSM2598]|uniref:TAXI family TRAP transporter solute-binding subunit n=1 Tax=Methylobacterium sp. WSM2598 TaxID=398261 RepID=UPI0003609D2E|nr:TAXI family TRAP transporter solute-binding subunit [Methylobacterium sp. WSM2598]